MADIGNETELKLRTENLVENKDINNSMFGENKAMDRLIVMNNVLGTADSCKEFADFLTITQKISFPLHLYFSHYYVFLMNT